MEGRLARCARACSATLLGAVYTALFAAPGTRKRGGVGKECAGTTHRRQPRGHHRVLTRHGRHHVAELPVGCHVHRAQRVPRTRGAAHPRRGRGGARAVRSHALHAHRQPGGREGGREGGSDGWREENIGKHARERRYGIRKSSAHSSVPEVARATPHDAGQNNAVHGEVIHCQIRPARHPTH
jgi:hypothetical protein